MPPTKTDPNLSAQAVADRLDDLRDLYRLAQSLADAKVLGPWEVLRARDSATLPDDGKTSIPVSK